MQYNYSLLGNCKDSLKDLEVSMQYKDNEVIQASVTFSDALPVSR